MMQTAEQLQAVYVAWQEPESRRYYPVGRLIAGAGSAHDLYEFSYIKGAEEAAGHGFTALPGFDDLHGVYRSKELFPFFENRLMSPNRPDYPGYVRSLGLDMNADPMLILARSGGTRATDSIELFCLPIRSEDGAEFHTYFWMHGFRHMEEGRQSRVLSLQPGEELLALPERGNSFDSNAIQLVTADHVKVGYMPRYLASEINRSLNAGVAYRTFVERVNPSPAPTQQRLLCRLEATCPDGFGPFGGDIYQPISAEATKLQR
jgi:hypothetical protein